MITYCSKCGINWASLHTQELDGECYEFCPVCNTDMHLQDGNDIMSYICCPFTGTITNTYNGQVMQLLIPKPPVVKKYQYWSRSRLSNAVHLELEDKALDAYHNTGNRQDYFNTFKNYQ